MWSQAPCCGLCEHHHRPFPVPADPQAPRMSRCSGDRRRPLDCGMLKPEYLLRFTRRPFVTQTATAILAELTAMKAGDVDWEAGRLFSLAFKADETGKKLAEDAYRL